MQDHAESLDCHGVEWQCTMPSPAMQISWSGLMGPTAPIVQHNTCFQLLRLKCAIMMHALLCMCTAAWPPFFCSHWLQALQYIGHYAHCPEYKWPIFTQQTGQYKLPAAHMSSSVSTAVKWWVMSDEWWVMSDEWWVMSDECVCMCVLSAQLQTRPCAHWMQGRVHSSHMAMWMHVTKSS